MLPWWDESTSIKSPHLPHQWGDASIGVGSPAGIVHSEQERTAICCLICLAMMTCLTTTKWTSLLRPQHSSTKAPPFKTCIFSREVWILSQSCLFPSHAVSTEQKTKAGLTLKKNYQNEKLASSFNNFFPFITADKYYRVDLQTKRVDAALPPYPRSIAKYWLGCEHEGIPDTSRAEKR